VTLLSLQSKHTGMTDETLTPISTATLKTGTSGTQLGRSADRGAMIIAGTGALFSILGAIWFFLGFAENDTRPEHLTSAFALTLILFAFAIIPFALVARFAKRAYQSGTRRAELVWTLFLMLPWIVLSSLTVSHTPLPLWSGLIAAIFAGLLAIWALVSLILDRQDHSLDTDISPENEMSDAES